MQSVQAKNTPFLVINKLLNQFKKIFYAIGCNVIFNFYFYHNQIYLSAHRQSLTDAISLLEVI